MYIPKGAVSCEVDRVRGPCHNVGDVRHVRAGLFGSSSQSLQQAWYGVSYEAERADFDRCHHRCPPSVFGGASDVEVTRFLAYLCCFDAFICRTRQLRVDDALELVGPYDNVWSLWAIDLRRVDNVVVFEVDQELPVVGSVQQRTPCCSLAASPDRTKLLVIGRILVSSGFDFASSISSCRTGLR